MTDLASMDAWTPQDLDRLWLAIFSGDEERKFRRWRIRQAARCRKARRGWR